jgi:hypothetical protein
MLAPLVIALASCGGDEEERREVEGFVTINATSQTYRATLELSGTRYASAHTVNWTTGAGASGPANLTFQSNCVLFPLPIVVSECNHRWNASVPLLLGANSITVMAFGDDGDWGQATTTVTREPCPSGWLPEFCS